MVQLGAAGIPATCTFARASLRLPAGRYRTWALATTTRAAAAAIVAVVQKPGEEQAMLLALVHHLGAQVGVWFYLVAGALVFAEAAMMVGLVFPGETALLVAGLAIHEGWIAWWPMVTIGVFSAVLGDAVGYQLGRHFGPALRTSPPGRRAGEGRWLRADAFLRRYGGRAVLMGRWVAVLRAVTPGLAGMARMPYLRTFLPWNILGAVVWAPGCVLLGYAFSASLSLLGRFLTYGPLVVLALAAAALMAVRGWGRRQARGSR
jgi:membrane-associated protein